MSIAPEEVRKVALLARLLLSEDEVAEMATQLSRILAYMEVLRSVDTSQVEPMAHPLELVNVFRDDKVRPGLAREEALKNAPKHDGECYLVPAVLGPV
ncbi:MAG: Asp-tRNA(Asn)/Glu-tRNA(Gln) amidotransferase subunit GatC [Thermoguttaceae bacterium]|nr:Asp-tRNA(Asn)/Glu-tRNA(Gln) amidotransferase subunit GatC [Thermoguttaceae bacterium]MDW8078392.1 Asp-tRNA(Asn)/Glu-tRNA(Gln) amidotransferase subunit GatC [Thermoguttaceae bacterium]